jgi:hypothetical protein
VLAFFPQSWHLEIERWISAAFDTLNSQVVYLFSVYYLLHVNYQGEPARMALWISVLFVFSPALTSVGTGPRAYQGTARTFGELLFMLSMSCSIVYFFEGILTFLFLGGFFGGLLLLTSKFGAQVLVFFNIILFLYFRDITWVIVPAMSFLCAFLFSWGHYKEIAAGHVEHCQYYRKAISKRFYMVSEKNRLADLKNVIHDFYQDYYRAARTLLMNNTYTLLLLKNPQLFYVLFLVVANALALGKEEKLLLVWTGAGLLAFLITSLKPFLFLGEADRYVEYGLLPQFILIGIAENIFPFTYYILGYEVILYIAFVSIFIHQYSQKAKDLSEFKEMASFIRSDNSIQRILPIYLNDAIQLAYESGKGIAHFPGNFRDRFFPVSEFLSFYGKVYPFPDEDLCALMKYYKYDVIYFSDNDMRKARQYDLKYDVSEWTNLFSNEKYTVLKPR